MTFLATLAAKLGHQFSARAGSFVRHDRASTAVVFGLAFIPIMLAIGAAVDYARASTMKSRMQAAVDSAALAAAAAQAKGGNAVTIASAYVAQQFPAGELTVSTTTTTDTAQGKVTVKAAASVPTAIMKIANVRSINISATATAQMDVSGGGKTEVVLAIDTTGSTSLPRPATPTASHMIAAGRTIPASSMARPCHTATHRHMITHGMAASARSLARTTRTTWRRTPETRFRRCSTPLAPRP
jgi:Flp pilus assembly protein TadG